MIGQSNTNERLHEMTPNRMLLDVSVLPKKRFKYNKHLILIRLCYMYKLRPFNKYLHQSKITKKFLFLSIKFMHEGWKYISNKFFSEDVVLQNYLFIKVSDSFGLL